MAIVKFRQSTNRAGLLIAPKKVFLSATMHLWGARREEARSRGVKLSEDQNGNWLSKLLSHREEDDQTKDWQWGLPQLMEFAEKLANETSQVIERSDVSDDLSFPAQGGLYVVEFLLKQQNDNASQWKQGVSIQCLSCGEDVTGRIVAGEWSEVNGPEDGWGGEVWKCPAGHELFKTWTWIS